jgi:hypothetical protein
MATEAPGTLPDQWSSDDPSGPRARRVIIFADGSDVYRPLAPLKRAGCWVGYGGARAD